MPTFSFSLPDEAATERLGAALASLLPFGARFFRDQIAAIGRGRIRDYRAIFRDITRWQPHPLPPNQPTLKPLPK